MKALNYIFKFTWLIIILLLIPGKGYSEGYVSADNYTGLWDDIATWTKSQPWMFDTPDDPGQAGSQTNGNSQYIHIYGYITHTGDLFKGSDTHITIYDTLWVTGNLSIGGSGGLTIAAGGVLIVDGNLTTLGGTSTVNNGNVVVRGNLSLTESGNVTNNSTGSDGFTVYGSSSRSGGASYNGSPAPPTWNTRDESELSSDNTALYNFINGTLPVEFGYVSVKNENESVIVGWSTKTEINNKEFRIERASEDGEFWEIGSVGGNGTSNEELTYFFYDRNPQVGKNYYRIKQIDYDGMFDFSKVVGIEIADIEPEFIVFPSVLKSNQSFSFQCKNIKDGNGSLIIVSMDGEVIHKSMQSPTDLANLNLNMRNDVKEGIYIVRYTINGDKYQRKLIVTRN